MIKIEIDQAGRVIPMGGGATRGRIRPPRTTSGVDRTTTIHSRRSAVVDQADRRVRRIPWTPNRVRGEVRDTPTMSRPLGGNVTPTGFAASHATTKMKRTRAHIGPRATPTIDSGASGIGHRAAFSQNSILSTRTKRTRRLTSTRLRQVVGFADLRNGETSPGSTRSAFAM